MVSPCVGSNPTAPTNKAARSVTAQISATPTNHLHRSDSFEENFFASSGTYVHPTAIVGERVTLGANVKIGPYCVVLGNVRIGDNTKLMAHVTVGFPAQDVGTPAPLGVVHIGANCTIREFVTIHAPKHIDGATSIGNNCYLMTFSHVAHDVTLEDNVILINNATIGGHAHIERNVMLMAGAAIHQFCRVGRYSCITPYSGARQDAPPFCMHSGGPIGFAGLNKIALRRAGFSPDDMAALKTVTRRFYVDKILLADLQAQAAIAPWGQNKHVQDFLSFIAVSKRGVSRRIHFD